MLTLCSVMRLSTSFCLAFWCARREAPSRDSTTIRSSKYISAATWQRKHAASTDSWTYIRMRRWQRTSSCGVTAQGCVRSVEVGASSYQPRSSLCSHKDTERNNNIMYSSMLTRDEKKDVQHDVYRAPLDLYPLALLT
jgi:hypothetical protein